MFEFLDNQVPVGLCTLIHPGIEDCANGSPKLCFWILRELLAKLQLDHGFVRLDQFFQVLWKQLTVLQGMISLKMKDVKDVKSVERGGNHVKVVRSAVTPSKVQESTQKHKRESFDIATRP